MSDPIEALEERIDDLEHNLRQLTEAVQAWTEAYLNHYHSGIHTHDWVGMP